MTAENLIGELWRRCLKSAREADEMPAEAVQGLIGQSREILTQYGATKQQADSVLFGVYTMIHWDWDRPTDRIFEALLEMELAEFFSERGLTA